MKFTVALAFWPNRKYGIIVCILKLLAALYIEDYRLLTILNTDFKLLTRIIANRLRR